MSLNDAALLKQAQPIFEQLIEYPQDQWTHQLPQLCTPDSPLFKAVQSLMDAHLIADSHSTEVINKSMIDTLNDAHNASVLGTQFGAYRLTKKIGSGGMGDVYLAERSDNEYNKQVAIKVVRTQFVDEAFNQWLRSERQILANLEHPNICRLLDGNTDITGKPYLVMEYVDGDPITTYCQQLQLSTRQILELFLTLCDAVSYAHQNLIVHRDIKPGNILVTEQGDVKLMDFGIAQPLHKEAPRSQLAQYARTANYASPEQCQNKTVGIQSDIYSLGIVLKELLALPHLPPNSKHSENMELMHITSVATQTDPQDRYLSLAHFSDEIQRFLDGFSPINFPGSWRNRLSKLIMRNPWTSASLVLLTGLAASFIFTITTYNQQLKNERNTAIEEKQRAATTAKFLVDIFRLTDTLDNHQDIATIQRILVNVKRKLDAQFFDDSLLKVDLLQTLANVHYNLGQFEQAHALLLESEMLLAQHYQQDVLKLAQNDTLLVKVLIASNQISEATQKVSRALTAHRKALGNYSRATLINLHQMAEIHKYKGEYQTAQQLFEEVVQHRQIHHSGIQVEQAATYVQLAEIYLNNGEFEQADNLLSGVLQQLDSTDLKTQTVRSDVIHFLAVAKRALSEHQRALELFKANLVTQQNLYPEGHPSIAIALRNMGMTYEFMGELDQSERYLRDALKMSKVFYGLQHEQTLHNINNLAYTLMKKSKYKEAELLFRQVFSVSQQLYGHKHYIPGIHLTNIVIILNKQNQYQQACALTDQAKQLMSGSLARDHWRYSVLNSAKGQCLHSSPAQAKQLLVSSYENLKLKLGDNSSYTKEALERLLLRFSDYAGNL